MDGGQFKHASHNEEAKKCGGIFKLYYKKSKLYAACATSISIWDFDIASRLFKYSGDFPINKYDGPAVDLDSLDDNLFFAQVGSSKGGNVTAVKTTQAYNSCGNMPEAKEVSYCVNV